MISQNPVKGIWKKLVLQSKALHPHQICSVISILVIVKGESAQVINTHVILSGLQIRIKDEVSTYPLSRVTGTLKMTDWLSVRKEESTSRHIRCYWLDDGKEEDLPTFMSDEFDSTSVVVLLLVNNKDNFKIDAKFLCIIEEYEFPVAVVTRSVGQILEDLLQKHKREVQGRLEMSTVTTNFQDETKQEQPQGESLNAVHFGYELT